MVLEAAPPLDIPQEQHEQPPTPPAADVAREEYMAHYAADHYEWVEGVLIPMSPATQKHNNGVYFEALGAVE